VGRGPHFRVESDHHGGSLFAALVGDTAIARKGTSWGHVRRLMGAVDGDWQRDRIASGLTSGEGLVWAVRDPAGAKRRKAESDPGVSDKRLLVVESELAAALKVMGREGNTLSPILRCAWDGTDLSTLAKNSPARATAPHVSVIGHITATELLRYLDSTEIANGLGNRFLWCLVRRSKSLPEGGCVPEAALSALRVRVGLAVTRARRVGQVQRDDAARALWDGQYDRLMSPPPGLLEALLARGPAQVVRLSLLYALLDSSNVIRVEHQQAALALWDYTERSARRIFGDALGDRTADRVLAVLAEAGAAGCTRTEVRDAFGRHQSGDIDRALSLLLDMGRVIGTRELTAGRPCERYYLATKATEATEAPPSVASVAATPRTGEPRPAHGRAAVRNAAADHGRAGGGRGR
jgi:hypothetical protein